MNDTSVPPVVPDFPPMAPAPQAGPTPVAFTGSRPEFRGLVVRGAFLEFITLGFYRFWLATDIRRHLWSNTAVDGDAIEYTGTAKELLIGFLVALAIMVPIYLAYFFITLEAEALQAFASIPLGLFFYLFYQFALYRARRYRLSRTIWRGVRFWMTGSGWAYAWRAGLLSLAVIFTFGLALPWYNSVLERYKMRHTHYGDLQGSFAGTGWGLFARYIWFWLGAILFVALSIGLIYMDATAAAGLGLALFIGWPFAHAAYKAIEWRWWANGIRFGDVRFESTLRSVALAGLYWKVILWSILIFVFVGLWFSGVAYFAWTSTGVTEFNPEALVAVMQSVPMLIAIGAGYLIAAMAFATIVRIYLRRDVWARVAATTMVHNLDVAMNVAARGDAAGALGEGFFDSLDIGGI